MDKIKLIEEYVDSNQKNGFDGYRCMKKQLRKLNEEELNYVETKFILEKKSNERLVQFDAVVPLFVSLYALLVTIIPDSFKETVQFLDTLMGQLLIVCVFSLLIYLFLHSFPSKKINRCTFVLKIIEEIKNER